MSPFATLPPAPYECADCKHSINQHGTAADGCRADDSLCACPNTAADLAVHLMHEAARLSVQHATLVATPRQRSEQFLREITTAAAALGWDVAQTITTEPNTEVQVTFVPFPPPTPGF